MSEKIPPHDADIEKTVLGSLITYSGMIGDFFQHVKPEDFYLPIHRIIFSLFMQLLTFGHVDELAFRQFLKSQSKINFDVDVEMAILLNPSQVTPHITTALDALLRLSRERKAMTLGTRLVEGDIDGALANVHELENNEAKEDVVEALESEINAEIQGTRYAVEIPDWKVLSSTQCLMPGSITLICGSPGVSKSFFALEPVWRWMLLGEKVGALELEKGARFHIRRALAQISGESKLLKTRWVRDNPDRAQYLFAHHRQTIERLKDTIQAPSDNQKANCDFLLGWMRNQCNRGRRVLVIDPITIMQGQEKRFLDHEKFVYEAQKIVTKHGASLICVTHPRKGSPGEEVSPCLENIPGSAAWERFTDTIFWLLWHEPTSGVFGGVNAMYNRTMCCLKVRLDANPGRIGYFLDGQTLRHEERGVIEGEA